MESIVEKTLHYLTLDISKDFLLGKIRRKRSKIKQLSGSIKDVFIRFNNTFRGYVSRLEDGTFLDHKKKKAGERMTKKKNHKEPILGLSKQLFILEMQLKFLYEKQLET